MCSEMACGSVQCDAWEEMGFYCVEECRVQHLLVSYVVSVCESCE